MNPILPLNIFIPDPEAHACSDGRLYFYGSTDICGNNSYCSREYKVFSTDDMVTWTDHGNSFSTRDKAVGEDFYNQVLFAPDCIEKDGKHYLYFCTSAGSEGVAVSDTPCGYFKNAVPVKGAHLDGIDPAVFVDDDGQAYYYWGQDIAKGAKLKDSMTEIDEATLTHVATREKHGFHEGSSMRKRNGLYYFVYADISSGKPTCLSYATSRSPLGPFVKGGVIIDNAGCDPESWNNHGSIAEYKGNWYVFYHRSTQNGNYNRRVCVEPITFNEDGSINQVEMTTQGAGKSLDPGTDMDAGRACLLGGSAYIDQNDNGEEYIRAMHCGDFAVYKYYDFRKEYTHFEAVASSLTYGGIIEIREDHKDGKLLGVCEIKPTGGWSKWESFSCPVQSAKGIHAICLVFKKQYMRLFNLKKFRFMAEGRKLK